MAPHEDPSPSPLRSPRLVDRILATLVLSALLLLISSCSSLVVVRDYRGPARSPAEVALLTFEPGMYLGTPDGQWIGGDVVIEMIPGMHTIMFALYERRGAVTVGSSAHEMTVMLDAGRIYRLSADRHAPSNPRTLRRYLPRAQPRLSADRHAPSNPLSLFFEWTPDLRDVTKSFAADTWLRKREQGVDVEGWRAPPLD